MAFVRVQVFARMQLIVGSTDTEFSRAGNAFLCLHTPILPETFEYSVMQIIWKYVFVTSLRKGSKGGNNPSKPTITI